jgi:hypothetical protein
VQAGEATAKGAGVVLGIRLERQIRMTSVPPDLAPRRGSMASDEDPTWHRRSAGLRRS